MILVAFCVMILERDDTVTAFWSSANNFGADIACPHRCAAFGRGILGGSTPRGDTTHALEVYPSFLRFLPLNDLGEK